jgi:hypothetical protein
MSAISERAKMSKDYTRKRVNELINHGYVKITRKGCGRYSNTYLLEDISTKINDDESLDSFLSDFESESTVTKDINSYEMIDSEMTESTSKVVKNTMPTLVMSTRGSSESTSKVVKSAMPTLVDSTRGNNKNKTKINEQYLSIEEEVEEEDLRILKICNDLRKRRFGLEALEAKENLGSISVALKNHNYEDIERVAKHYFNYANSEFMTPLNAFKPDKLKNKIQGSKDYFKGKETSYLFEDTPLTDLINQGKR